MGRLRFVPPVRTALAGVLCAWGGIAALSAQTSPAPTPAAAPAAGADASTAPDESHDSPFVIAYRKALIAFKLKTYDQADAAIDQAIKIDPQDARGPILKGRITAALEKPEAAETLIKQGLALDPASTIGHRALGDLHFHQRHYDAARVAYLDAQRYGDADPDLNLLVFYCDIGSKELGEAQKIFVTFNSFDEKYPHYYFAKAALARAEGNDPAARKDLQDATVLYGNELFARYAADYFFLFASKP